MVVEEGEVLNTHTYADERGEPFIEPVIGVEMMLKDKGGQC